MQVVEVSGVQAGSVLVTQSECLIRGVTADARIVSSIDAGAVVCPYPPATPTIRRLIIEDVILDANNLGFALSAMWWSGLTDVDLHNVELRNYTNIGIHAADVEVAGAGLVFDGPGIAVQVDRGAVVDLDGVHVRRGRCGLMTGDDGLIKTASKLRNFRVARSEPYRYWNTPGHETTLSNPGAFEATLAVMPPFWPATPPPVQTYDQLRAVSPEGAIVLARVSNWGGNEVQHEGWRYTNAARAPAPAAGSAIRVIKTADTDVGGIKLNSDTRRWRIEDVKVEDGKADLITVDGHGHTLRRCEARNGEDMAFTLRGFHVLQGCIAGDIQYSAFIVDGAGGAILRDCIVEGNRAAGFDPRLAPFGALVNCTEIGDG